MLVLDFIEKRDNIKNNKKIFCKKRNFEKANEIKRQSVNINGKNVIVLELSEKDLQNEEVLTLLKIYEGRVLVSEKYRGIEALEKYLYNPKMYYQRAVLSSFVNQIKTVNKGWKNISIKIDSFIPFSELYDIVKLSKSVTIITRANAYTERFLKECYYEYGAGMSLKNDTPMNNDVLIDLEKTDDKGKLMINVNGKDFLLYPDIRYFENCSEYQKLSQYNIEHNLICAAFSVK